MDPFAGFLDEPDTLHKYLYVGNDPVNFTDPSGLAEMSEYVQRAKQQVRDTITYMRKHARDLMCRTIKTASVILKIPGSVFGLKTLLQTAIEWGLEACCKELKRSLPNLYPGDPIRNWTKWPLLNIGGKWVLKSGDKFRSATGRYQFVTQGGRVWVSKKAGHYEIAGGKAVDFAGEIVFGNRRNRGILKFWNNASGHYLPDFYLNCWSTLPLAYWTRFL